MARYYTHRTIGLTRLNVDGFTRASPQRHTTALSVAPRSRSLQRRMYNRSQRATSITRTANYAVNRWMPT